MTRVKWAAGNNGVGNRVRPSRLLNNRPAGGRVLSAAAPALIYHRVYQLQPQAPVSKTLPLFGSCSTFVPGCFAVQAGEGTVAHRAALLCGRTRFPGYALPVVLSGPWVQVRALFHCCPLPMLGNSERACRQAIWLQLSPREGRRCRLASSALAPG
jgi:hypothetical protein